MPLEYQTVKFTNDGIGLSEKDRFTREMVTRGWHIVSEQVEQGHMQGGQACCLASICLPLGLAAGRTPGNIIVTFGRELILCEFCGSYNPLGAIFCRACGKKLGPA